jgi:hypothetical protein
MLKTRSILPQFNRSILLYGRNMNHGIQAEINDLDKSIHQKLTNIFEILFSNKSRILEFKKKLKKILEKTPKFTKTRHSVGGGGKKKRKTQKNQSASSTEISSCNAVCDARANNVNMLLMKIIQFHFMILKLVPAGVGYILKLILEIFRLMNAILYIPVIGGPLVLAICYVLYTNPYTRITINIFMNITSAIWNMGPDFGIDRYIQEEVEKLKTILYGAFVYLVQYYGAEIVAQLAPEMAEYIAKTLFDKYLDGAVNEIISRHVSSSELAGALNRIETNVIDNVRRLVAKERGAFSTGNSLTQLENMIHTLSGNNREALLSIEREIGSIRQLMLYNGDNFQMNAKLERLEKLLLTN